MHWSSLGTPINTYSGPFIGLQYVKYVRICIIQYFTPLVLLCVPSTLSLASCGFDNSSYIFAHSQGNTLRIVKTLIAELMDLFPDEYFHIGCDETSAVKKCNLDSQLTHALFNLCLVIICTMIRLCTYIVVNVKVFCIVLEGMCVCGWGVVCVCVCVGGGVGVCVCVRMCEC